MRHWRMRGVQEQERCRYFSNDAHAILPHKAGTQVGSCSAPASSSAQQIAVIGAKAWVKSASSKAGLLDTLRCA